MRLCCCVNHGVIGKTRVYAEGQIIWIRKGIFEGLEKIEGQLPESEDADENSICKHAR